MYKHLLIPTDGSKLSDVAVKHGIGLARALGARVTFYYAVPDVPEPLYLEGDMLVPYVPPESYTEQARLHASRVLAKVQAKASSVGIEAAIYHSLSAEPYEGIIAAAKKKRCDAIVMASHGRRGVAGLLLGSETQKVLTHSKVPVLVVR